MTRRSTIAYRVPAKEEGGQPTIKKDLVYINNVTTDDIQQGNQILLRIRVDKETNEATTEANRDGITQYVASLPTEDGAFAYIPVNSMKALLATGRVRDLEGEKWVQLTLDPIQPPLSTFNRGTTVASL